MPFGAFAMYRVAGKVPRGLMTERWHLGTLLGNRFPHRRKHCGTTGRRPCDQIQGCEGTEPMTMVDLDAIKGSPWGPSGVLRDVLPDVPPAEPGEERPVPRNMKSRKTC